MSMSDGIGLKHVVMAAGKCNIDVELWQEDDRVFFKATYPTTVASRQSSDCAFANDQNDAQTLPSGLHIACIDDSKVARIGLHGALLRLIDQSTVTVFGSSLEEVDQFKQSWKVPSRSASAPPEWPMPIGRLWANQRQPVVAGLDLDPRATEVPIWNYFWAPPPQKEDTAKVRRRTCLLILELHIRTRTESHAVIFPYNH